MPGRVPCTSPTPAGTNSRTGWGSTSVVSSLDRARFVPRQAAPPLKPPMALPPRIASRRSSSPPPPPRVAAVEKRRSTPPVAPPSPAPEAVAPAANPAISRSQSPPPSLEEPRGVQRRAWAPEAPPSAGVARRIPLAADPTTVAALYKFAPAELVAATPRCSRPKLRSRVSCRKPVGPGEPLASLCPPLAPVLAGRARHCGRLWHAPSCATNSALVVGLWIVAPPSWPSPLFRSAASLPSGVPPVRRRRGDVRGERLALEPQRLR
jgi:hypothetical protein